MGKREPGEGKSSWACGLGSLSEGSGDHLIYDVTGPSVQPDAVTIMPRP